MADPPNFNLSQLTSPTTTSQASAPSSVFLSPPATFSFGSTSNTHNVHPTTNIFGGSAFTQASGPQLPGDVKPIFVPSGIPTAAPKFNITGDAPAKPEDAVSAVTRDVLGGSTFRLGDFQNPSKGSIFGGTASKSEDIITNTVPNLFGGPSSKAEDSKRALFRVSDLRSEETSDGPARISSNLEKRLGEKVKDRDPNEAGDKHEADEDYKTSERKKSSPRGTGRTSSTAQKRPLFARALEDVTKSSGKETSLSEDMISIECHLSTDRLNDKEFLKKHFSQFGPLSRMSTNPRRGYCLVSYKSHNDAAKAMKFGREISGTEAKLLWRNPLHSRRKSTEGDKKSRSDKSSDKEDERKIPKNQSVTALDGKKLRDYDDLDESVREELAAMSDLDNDRSFAASLRKASRLSRDPNDSTLKPVISRARKSGKDQTPDDKKIGPSLSEKISTRLGAIKSSTSSKIGETEMKPVEEDTSTTDTAIASTAGASELLAIMRQPAHTLEDRLRVLEARDKLIRLRQVKQTDLAKAVKTVGTCPDMCPEKERLLRETRRQISQYEISLKSGQMDPSLMVKQYSRSSADQEEPLPHELRPPIVLTMTMNYLLHSIMDLCDQPGENLAEWYHFLWDRTRGIRKEITQQELCNVDAVFLVEQCARFHIHCCARLAAEDMSVFDDRINTENLTKCLQTLKHMYHDLWINNSVTCPNEPEFLTYFLLLNLNNGTIMWELEQLREEVLMSPSIGFAASLYNSLSSNNFVRFFRLVRQASYLNSCLCIRYFYQVRSLALRTFVKAFAKTRPVAYPMTSLERDLGFENLEEAALFCAQHGLQVDYMKTEPSSVILSSDLFTMPTSVPAPVRAFKLVESKKVGSVGEVVYGGALPSRTFETHLPHNSFDSDGKLRRTAWSAKDQGASDSKEEDLFLEEEIRDLESKGQCIKRTESEVNTDKRLPVLTAIPSAPSQMSAAESVSATSSRELAVMSLIDTTPKPIRSIVPSSHIFHKPAPKEGLLQTLSPSTPLTFLQPQPVPPPPAFNEMFTRPPEVSSQGQKLAAWTIRSPSAVMRGPFPTPAQVQLEMEKKAAEQQEKTVTEAAGRFSEEIIASFITETVQVEAKASLEEAKEHDLRKRLLDNHVDRMSNETMNDLLHNTVNEMLREVAARVLTEEHELELRVEQVSLSFFEDIFSRVLIEECKSFATSELRAAQEKAREEALKQRVADCFYHWLHHARRSLRMRHAMEDFPAGVMHLSIKEHADRWGFPGQNQLDVWKGSYGRHEKALDIPEVKAPPAFPQTTLAEMVGVMAVHRYDLVRNQLGLYPTDQILYKVLVSVSEEPGDRGGLIPELWIRKTFKQRNSMLYDNKKEGVLRYVSGQKVAADVIVFASLQLVKGTEPLVKHRTLVAGTSAIFFMVSPDSGIEGSQSRLSALLRAAPTLPPPPLVVGVVCPVEPSLEALRLLVAELQLDVWLQTSAICDYQILHLRDCTDPDYLMERFKPALSYMVMTWTPVPHLDLVQLRSIMNSTFQMFYISVQFNYNSSELYPQDIEDPTVIIGLVNEWVDRMCSEFLHTLREAKELCAEEFWPLLYKGAYLPFYLNSEYEQHLAEVMAEMRLPEVVPISEGESIDEWFHIHTKWMKVEDQKKTFKRVSCLDMSLPWPDLVKSIPWMQLVEDWVEIRFRYVNTTKLCSTELMVLVCSQRLEQVYTSPWWAHSKHIRAYLESHKTGRENEMDFDQTVPFSESMDQTMKSVDEEVEAAEKTCFTGRLEQLNDVATCLGKLKEVNSSLTERIKAALGNYKVPAQSSSALQWFEDDEESVVVPKSSSVRTLVKHIDSQIQMQRNVNSNVTLLLSDALASDGKVEYDESSVQANTKKNHLDQNIDASENTLATCLLKNDAIEEENNTFKEDNSFPSVDLVSHLSNQDLEADGEVTDTLKSKKMDHIMASMQNIVANLNQKYGISSLVPKQDRIQGLLFGMEQGDREAVTMPLSKLQESYYIEASQDRMEERLRRQSSARNQAKERKRSRMASLDDDIEVVCEDGVGDSDIGSSSPLNTDGSLAAKTKRQKMDTSPVFEGNSFEDSTSTVLHSDDSPSPLSVRSYHSNDYVHSPTSDEESPRSRNRDYVRGRVRRRGNYEEAEIVSSDSRSSVTYHSDATESSSDGKEVDKEANEIPDGDNEWGSVHESRNATVESEDAEGSNESWQEDEREESDMDDGGERAYPRHRLAEEEQNNDDYLAVEEEEVSAYDDVHEEEEGEFNEEGDVSGYAEVEEEEEEEGEEGEGEEDEAEEEEERRGEEREVKDAVGVDDIDDDEDSDDCDAEGSGYEEIEEESISDEDHPGRNVNDDSDDCEVILDDD